MAVYVMYWINVITAASACRGVPHVLTKLEAHGIDAVAPRSFLPLIAALMLAAGGGVLCRYSELGADLPVPVIILPYIFIGMAQPLSIAFDSVFVDRLFDKAYPAQQKVYRIMILCEPPPQASFPLQDK
ncbi:hypothetical protein B0A54_17125 [Friedmanniomyces endolithicus]|uniref:Uncharacterized protein n=1 Tax=Friedmanniomyces endolithicus TaxID=329885 RepID=A0A4U0U0R1_9PEZI|nr:hypothetical protein B0A54_17125 [Friedmanniomyces endolithicus]